MGLHSQESVYPWLTLSARAEHSARCVFAIPGQHHIILKSGPRAMRKHMLSALDISVSVQETNRKIGFKLAQISAC